MGEDNTLRIEPVPAIESLRDQHQHFGETRLPANQELVLNGIEGNAMELSVELDPQGARQVSIDVLRAPGKDELTSVTFYRHGWLPANRASGCQQDAIAIDLSWSSLRGDVLARAPEVAPFELADGERLRLRVFVDRSVVEVFANVRQCMALRVYPERDDSTGVAIRAQGGDAVLHALDAWQMRSVYAQG